MQGGWVGVATALSPATCRPFQVFSPSFFVGLELTKAVSSLTEQAEDKQIELTDILRELSKDVARLQTQLWDEHLAKLFSTTTRKADEIKKPPDETKKQLEDGLDELTTDVTGLRATQERHSLLLYVVIGLLVWLLIKLW